MTITGNPISDIILILWFFSAFFDYLDFTYLWQLKEYRIDLFREFLRTKQGGGFLRGYRVFWRAIFAVVVFTFLRDSFRYDTYTGLHIITLIILLVDLLYNLSLYRQRSLRRPVLTKRVLMTIFFAFVFEAGVILIVKQLNILLLLLVFRFVLVSAVVICMRFPTEFLKYIYKKLATKKMVNYPNLIVIGVTGSYGKSTVKKFLSHILSYKYKTVFTPKNINTEIGVAKFVLDTNFDNVAVFVCEMGAYKMGEIKAITDIVRPRIGILTAINEQHLSIFGHIRHTQKAKFELINSLPKNGLAILNVDNEYIREKINDVSVPIMTYGSDLENKPNLLIKSSSCDDGGLNFTYQYQNNNYELRAEKICGEHNAYNLSACVLVAKYLDMDDTDITLAVRTVTLPTGTLNLLKYKDSIIIDDSYNSNPDGFRSALYTLSGIADSRRRIVVTRGMLELGEDSNSLHEQIGNEIAFNADELIIISPDHAGALRLGVGTKYNIQVRTIYDFNELEKYLLDIIEDKVVVLLENRLPPHIYRNLLSKIKQEDEKT